MKKLIFIFLILVNYNTVAQKIINSIDIINNSDTPITIEYDVCTSESISGRQVEFICNEKTNMLTSKNSGTNSVNVYFNEKKKSYNSVTLKKITSTFGEQDLLSFEDLKNIDFTKTSSYCHGYYLTNQPTIMEHPTSNVLVLDNLGTNKFYCHSTYQAN